MLAAFFPTSPPSPRSGAKGRAEVGKEVGGGGSAPIPHYTESVCLHTHINLSVRKLPYTVSPICIPLSSGWWGATVFSKLTVQCKAMLWLV